MSTVTLNPQTDIVELPAPSAHDWKEIDIHAVMPEGRFRYDTAGHRLMLVQASDLRKETGAQDFVGQAGAA